MATIEKRIGNEGKASYRVKVRVKGHPSLTATFNLFGFNSPQLAAICFKGERSEGKSRVIPRQLAARIAIFSLAVFIRKTDAKTWASETESAVKLGKHLPATESKKRIFNELADRWDKKILLQKKSQRTPKSVLQWWKNKLGPYSLFQITPPLISDYRDELLSEEVRKDRLRSPSTVNRYLAVLSSVFTYAQKELHWATSNPVLDVKKPSEPSGRVRFLSEEEREKLLNACKQSRNEYLYCVVVLALSTGMRKGEIFNLTWRNVDFKKELILIPETKNASFKAVPLVGHTKNLLQKLGKVRRLDTDLVFPSKSEPSQPVDIRKPWETAIVKAGIENFKFHDLRHTTASYLAMKWSFACRNCRSART